MTHEDDEEEEDEEEEEDKEEEEEDEEEEESTGAEVDNLESLTVIELKEELRKMDLPLSGRKAELIKRIRDAK